MTDKDIETSIKRRYKPIGSIPIYDNDVLQRMTYEELEQLYNKHRKESRFITSIKEFRDELSRKERLDKEESSKEV